MRIKNWCNLSLSFSLLSSRPSIKCPPRACLINIRTAALSCRCVRRSVFCLPTNDAIQNCANPPIDVPVWPRNRPSMDSHSKTPVWRHSSLSINQSIYLSRFALWNICHPLPPPDMPYNLHFDLHLMTCCFMIVSESDWFLSFPLILSHWALLPLLAPTPLTHMQSNGFSTWPLRHYNSRGGLIIILLLPGRPPNCCCHLNIMLLSMLITVIGRRLPSFLAGSLAQTSPLTLNLHTRMCLWRRNDLENVHPTACPNGKSKCEKYNYH